MKALLFRVADRIDQASLRERVLIFAAMATLVFAVADLLLVEPQVAQQKRLTRELAQRRSEAASMQEQMARLVASRSASPERSNRERLERARNEIAALERRITEEQSRFTRPEQMRAVLEEMLSRNRNVALVEIRTLDSAAAGTMSPSPVKSPAQVKPVKPAPAGL
jgi:type II secretory pathway component PulM